MAEVGQHGRQHQGVHTLGTQSVSTRCVSRLSSHPAAGELEGAQLVRSLDQELDGEGDGADGCGGQAQAGQV